MAVADSHGGLTAQRDDLDAAKQALVRDLDLRAGGRRPRHTVL
jgi:hypothetical protein